MNRFIKINIRVHYTYYTKCIDWNLFNCVYKMCAICLCKMFRIFIYLQSHVEWTYLDEWRWLRCKLVNIQKVLKFYILCEFKYTFFPLVYFKNHNFQNVLLWMFSITNELNIWIHLTYFPTWTRRMTNTLCTVKENALAQNIYNQIKHIIYNKLYANIYIHIVYINNLPLCLFQSPRKLCPQESGGSPKTPLRGNMYGFFLC